jgi:hypothetical protein
MKNTKTAYMILTGCLLALAGCIQEFIPQNIREESGWLIVDGTITNGESVFVLSRSVGLSEELGEEVWIDGALVTVETGDGSAFPAHPAGRGRYVAQTGDLDMHVPYRLSFVVDDESYQSEYLYPVPTAGIDSIFLVKERKGDPLVIYLSADGQDGSKFYRWKYRETWEVRAELYATARWGPEGSVIFHSLNTPENTYYCWGRDSSKTLLLGNTEKLSQNIVSQQKMVEIPCDHDKLSILYHFEAEQMQLRAAAYRYFADLQEKVERTGDLFSPILGAGLRGNIRCADDPGRMVFGYVEVAASTRKDVYIWESEGFYEPFIYITGMDQGKGNPCYVSNPPRLNDPIYVYGESSTLLKCVDCRTKENASKDKPAGWPTEHL